MRFVDLSMPLDDVVPVDPPFLRPKIDRYAPSGSEGKGWTQTLELSDDAQHKLYSGQWTLVVDGHEIDPHHLPGKLKDAQVDIVDHHGVSVESFHGVDKIYPGTSTLLAEAGRINLTLRRVDRA